jgi:hypothetical protein
MPAEAHVVQMGWEVVELQTVLIWRSVVPLVLLSEHALVEPKPNAVELEQDVQTIRQDGVHIVALEDGNVGLIWIHIGI